MFSRTQPPKNFRQESSIGSRRSHISEQTGTNIKKIVLNLKRKRKQNLPQTEHHIEHITYTQIKLKTCHKENHKYTKSIIS